MLDLNFNNKIKCHYESREEKKKVEDAMELFEKKNKNVKCACENYINIVNTNGSSGIIFESEKGYTKLSNLPFETSKLFNKRDVNCDTLIMKIKKSIDENENSKKFSKLNEIFPNHIMKIYSTARCKNDLEIFSNVLNIEKVVGETLENFLQNINLENSQEQFNLVCCILQLIYITIYANLHGYVHNDLTTNNIIVYNIRNPFELDNLVINDNIINIKFKNNYGIIPVIKLIDFSYSTHIDPTTLNNKIIFGESIQIIKIILNKLKMLGKNFDLLNKINDLFYNFFGNIELFDYFIEMDIDISSNNGFRLLSDDKIKFYAIDNDDCRLIVLFFSKLFKIIHKLYPDSFECDISNVPIVNLKKKIKLNYLQKYFKYKNKYIGLKNKYIGLKNKLKHI